MKKIKATSSKKSLTVKTSKTVAKRVPKKRENALDRNAKPTGFSTDITPLQGAAGLPDVPRSE